MENRDEPVEVVAMKHINGFVYHCPDCYEAISTGKQTRIKYCQRCGQKLSWDGVNEKAK